MDLREAKKILNENGYELLEEGKLGRALGIGALALASLFGGANANNFDNLRDFETTEIQNEYQSIKNSDINWDKVVITENGIRARKALKNGIVMNLFKPSKHISNLNDNITAIIIGTHLSGVDEILTIIDEDGHVQHFTPEKMIVKDKNKNIVIDEDMGYKFFKEMVEYYHKFIKPI